MKLLISNRGEIALRILKTCQKLDIETVSIYTEADALSPHVKQSTESVFLGTDPKAYLNSNEIIKIAKEKSCDAIHPGYGFLSENINFVKACEFNNITFLGPSIETMALFSEKHNAKIFAKENQVPIIKGTNLINNIEEIKEATKWIGYPIMLKATGGGGGMGIHICENENDVDKTYEIAIKQGSSFFGNANIMVEKYVKRAKHIEVQIFGDGTGNVINLGVRECSIQRRHQKLLEETPPPSLNNEILQSISDCAVKLCSAAKYRSAGTVEFILDLDTNEFYFLEVNTRLQVEHGITEMVYHDNIDIVEWMIKLQLPQFKDEIQNYIFGKKFNVIPEGHALEIRIVAEDPMKEFKPMPGILGLVKFPLIDKRDVRIDTWIETGAEISMYYDSLLAKVMVHDKSRINAILKMDRILNEIEIKGLPTNIEIMKNVLKNEIFQKGTFDTNFLRDMKYRPEVIEVIEPGMMTTVQDYPGRTGLWHVGVPPSGPMDNFSFRIANAMIGNDDSAAGLEITVKGPKLLFKCDACIALTGASMIVKLDGIKIPLWTIINVKRDQVLEIGNKEENAKGIRTYLAVLGGIDIPDYLGSKSTFSMGNLGGVHGRPLKEGDILPIKESCKKCHQKTISDEWIPMFSGGPKDIWEIDVLPGPYSAPDYFLYEDITEIENSIYTVHYNSNRLGVRLEAPSAPKWARKDGGEGGSHPSNVHDYVYPIGSVNYTGDMPIILACDGPSLGGFVCPITITSSDLWKIGQVCPSDKIRWNKISLHEAYKKRILMEKKLSLIKEIFNANKDNEKAFNELNDYQIDPCEMPETDAILRQIPAFADYPGSVYRLAGDRYILVEYGKMELDLNLRIRVEMLERALKERNIDGLIEISPGVRSCLIEYDQVKLSLFNFIKMIESLDKSLGNVNEMKFQIRTLHLPAALNEKWTRGAIDKYMRSVRKEAAYLPSNIEFIAKCNAKESVEAVKDIIKSATYMVLGLGDVYLGAPCAVPLDPRHRLVVPKYNPARTFTPEGAIGIGGSYMCIYPMNSPGGYQLVGRTLPIWNNFGKIEPFDLQKPWLLNIFDHIKFFEVSEDELEIYRQQFKMGQYKIEIENTNFSISQYNDLIKETYKEVKIIKDAQKLAMYNQQLIDQKILKKLRLEMTQEKENEEQKIFNTGDEYLNVLALITGSVWDLKVKKDDKVGAEDVLVVLEAMKMEYQITSPCDGRVSSVMVDKSQLVHQGDVLIVISKEE